MTVNFTEFLIGLAIIALMLERFVEKLFGWIPKNISIGNQTLQRGYLLTLLIFVFGFLIAYFGEILALEVIFDKDVPKILDSLTTGLFIAAGADPIHQVIRWTEEKKELAKEHRQNNKDNTEKKKKGGRLNE